MGERGEDMGFRGVVLSEAGRRRAGEGVSDGVIKSLWER